MLTKQHQSTHMPVARAALTGTPNHNGQVRLSGTCVSRFADCTPQQIAAGGRQVQVLRVQYKAPLVVGLLVAQLIQHSTEHRAGLRDQVVLADQLPCRNRQGV